jgi:hypothetical protein
MVRSGPTPGAVAAFLGLLLLGKLARAVFDTMNHKALWFIPHGYIVYYVVRYQIIRAVKAQYRRAGNQAESVSGTRALSPKENMVTVEDSWSTTADVIEGCVQDGEGKAEGNLKTLRPNSGP